MVLAIIIFVVGIDFNYLLVGLSVHRSMHNPLKKNRKKFGSLKC